MAKNAHRHGALTYAAAAKTAALDVKVQAMVKRAAELLRSEAKAARARAAAAAAAPAAAASNAGAPPATPASAAQQPAAAPITPQSQEPASTQAPPPAPQLMVHDEHFPLKTADGVSQEVRVVRLGIGGPGAHLVREDPTLAMTVLEAAEAGMAVTNPPVEDNQCGISVFLQSLGRHAGSYGPDVQARIDQVWAAAQDAHRRMMGTANDNPAARERALILLNALAGLPGAAPEEVATEVAVDFSQNRPRNLGTMSMAVLAGIFGVRLVCYTVMPQQLTTIWRRPALAAAQMIKAMVPSDGKAKMDDIKAAADAGMTTASIMAAHDAKSCVPTSKLLTNGVQTAVDATVDALRAAGWTISTTTESIARQGALALGPDRMLSQSFLGRSGTHAGSTCAPGCAACTNAGIRVGVDMGVGMGVCVGVGAAAGSACAAGC